MLSASIMDFEGSKVFGDELILRYGSSEHGGIVLT